MGMLNLAVPSMTFDNIRQMRALDFSLSLPHLAFITHRLYHSQIPEVQAIGFKEKHTYTHIHTYIHTHKHTYTHTHKHTYIHIHTNTHTFEDDCDTNKCYSPFVGKWFWKFIVQKAFLITNKLIKSCIKLIACVKEL